MKLQAKFNLAMAGAFLLGLGLAAALSWQIANDNARQEVLRQAALIASEGDGVSLYTDQEIAPLLARASPDGFAPQTIPFLATQNVFRRIQKDWPAYSYKIAALNPTNPMDRAADWEGDIINTFRNDPKLPQLITTRQTVAGPVLSVAKPVRITEAGCLTCHSTPDRAPQVMTALYGPSNGFGWKLGSTVAATIVSVPMRVPLEHARQTFLVLLAALVLVFVLMVAAMNVLLRVFIVKPVGAVAAMADEVSLGKMDVPELPAKGDDEIASLAASFNRMRRSLVQALKLLDE
jgi:protein-histidine pros-kinase